LLLLKFIIRSNIFGAMVVRSCDICDDINR